MPLIAASTIIRANAIRAQRLRMYSRLTGKPIIPPTLDELEPIERELWVLVFDLDANTKWLEQRQ